jgi:DNA-binding NarL/FixJ family response regulator
VIVDDHGLFRAGVRSELGDAVEIVGEAATVAEAIPLILEVDPDVVLLDVHLPDGGGQAVIAGVALERPGVRFLALSVSDAAEDVIAVVRAGARGYVTKTISGEELVEAIERVAAGDAVFSPRLAGFVLDAFGSGEPVRDAELDELTPREREVLRLIARGYRYKEIAASLHLSVKTVESHVSSVLRKLQLSSRHELTRWAAERRMIWEGLAKQALSRRSTKPSYRSKKSALLRVPSASSMTSLRQPASAFSVFQLYWYMPVPVSNLSSDVEAETVSSIESCATPEQLDRRSRVIEVTAERTWIGTPFASLSRHLTGYARPARPTFTTGELSIGARKPSNA